MNIEINIPDAVSGRWSIETFQVESGETSERISALKFGRGVPAGTYKRLMRGGICVMSNTPDEIRDFLNFLDKAKGVVLINGLGLGVLLKALLDKDDVTEVIVIEKSQDVINLVGPTYLNDSRVSIINADCFEYISPKGKKYDAIWHDIWDYISAENLSEMKRLHRKYGRIAAYQESWCRNRCEVLKKEDEKFSLYY